MKKIYSKNTTVIIITLIIILFACKKTNLDNNTTTPPPIILITASVAGRVTDLNNAPVSGASVAAGASTTTTDANGQFTLKDIQLDKDAGFVKVTKAGYFTGSRTFLVNGNTTNNIKIQLLPKTVSGTIASSSGGNVDVTGGSKINFTASSFVNAGSNTAYSGDVSVAGYYLNPADANFREYMPGDLRGISTANKKGILKSFGMLSVEMNDAGGQKLQLATSKTATITIPIPSAMQAAAPATISLWYFDETKGIWKEEGTATKQTTNYVGAVSHFSFWNAGEPGADIRLDATFKDSSGIAAVTNKLVTITSVNFGTTQGYTDNNGKISGLAPANETLVMKVFDDCGAINYTNNIGPFSTNTDLGNINVSISNCSPATVTADFTYSAPYNIVPVFITFTNTSTYALNYVWDFGDGSTPSRLNQDGSTSTYSDPGHWYTTAGDYTVKLVTTGNGGVSDSTFKILHVGASDAYINLTLNGVDYSWTPSNYLLAGERSIDGGSNSITLIHADTLPVIFPKFRLSLTIHHDNASAGNIPPGDYPCSLYTVINDTAYSTYLSNPATNVSQYESAGGYITGAATGWIKYNQNNLPTTDSFPFTCTYRVVRIN